ncbi:MAG: PepSY domain-containing protein [Planctomycetales bacterium]|nr:PepSY domain-containing protein [Planctomycetales bacterium]
MPQEPSSDLSADRQQHRAPRLLTWRRSWLRVHRWLGLSVGLVFVLIGLTGSVLVFDHAIDEWLNPGLLISNASGARANVEQVIAVAEEHFGADALSVTKPRIANGVWSVWFASGSETQPSYTAVYVDPYMATVTGQRTWGNDLMSWMYRLHYQLAAGTTGAIAVGIIGLLVMVSIFSGVYLWWPMWRHSWRSGFTVRSGKRLSFDLHKVVGIVSALLLMVLAFTGVFMEFHSQCVEAIKSVARVTSPPEEAELKSKIIDGATPLTANAAIFIAARICPDGVFDHLHPPLGADGHYEVAFRQSNEVQTTFGRSQVFLDQYSGEVLAIRLSNESTIADAFIASQFPLHSGEALGFAGRITVFVSGLTPAILYMTGLLVWRRKTRRNTLVLKQSLTDADRGPTATSCEPFFTLNVDDNNTFVSDEQSDGRELPSLK